MAVLNLPNKWLKVSLGLLGKEILVTFILLVKRRLPKITCGFCNFDWTLMYSIISGTSTYFIILMQFDLASPRMKISEEFHKKFKILKFLLIFLLNLLQVFDNINFIL